jgi:hypothetical protein
MTGHALLLATTRGFRPPSNAHPPVMIEAVAQSAWGTDSRLSDPQAIVKASGIHAGRRYRTAGRAWPLALAVLATAASPSVAGPPYVTDDPEPTDTGNWENYLYIESAHIAGQGHTPEAGIELNYGAFKDTQLTWSVPLNPNPGPGGIGVVWEPLGGGVKYRFIEEDDNGWRPQIAFFPQIFIPVGPANRGAPVTELLPIWLQKSFGAWTMFGGGGYTRNPGPGNRDFLSYGLALQRQLISNLALGMEVFGQGRDTVSGHASAAVGMAAIFDFSDFWHLVGSVNTGISNARQADQFSFNLALKWTP